MEVPMDDDAGWTALLGAMEAAPDAPVAFEAEGRAIRPGYHVTELRRARIDAIDCGLGRRDWEEAQLQILEGSGGEPMTGRTLAGILRRGAEALALPGDAPLRVEAQPGGGALRRYRIGAVGSRGGATVVSLAAMGAECRPAALWAARRPVAAGCCAPAACCG
jgi:hypothetical protein